MICIVNIGGKRRQTHLGSLWELAIHKVSIPSFTQELTKRHDPQH